MHERASLESEVRSLQVQRKEDLGKIGQLRKLSDTQMNLLH